MANPNWKEQRKQILKLSNDSAHELTVEAIEQALIQLLQSEKLQTITVSDITRRAGVSRTAFYKNYQSKEDVISSILNKKFAYLLTKITDYEKENPADRAGMLITLFAALKSSEESIVLCAKADFGVMLTRIMDLLADQPQFRAINPYYPYYIAGAYHNVIIRWMETGMKESPEEMAQALMEIESPGNNHHTGGI